MSGQARPGIAQGNPKRGEIWTAAGGRDYGGKPRLVVVLQEDEFDGLESITVCGLTTSAMEAPIFRVPVVPTPKNGLREPCCLMADKVMTFPKSKLGTRIGQLDDKDILRLNQAVLVFLGLAASTRARQTP